MWNITKLKDVDLSSIVTDGGEIYFKAKDVATALGYVDPKGAIQTQVRILRNTRGPNWLPSPTDFY